MTSSERPAPIAVGSTSLLVCFAVLCLTVFALLTLSTVQADCRLSDKSCQASAMYYAADTQAETIFAQLRSGQVPDSVRVEGNRYFYSCPLGESQVLAVELEQVAGNQWRILRWQATPLSQENGDLYS